MPLLGREHDIQGHARVHQIGLSEQRGAVLRLRRPGGEVVLATGTGTIQGTVMDSLAIRRSGMR